MSNDPPGGNQIPFAARIEVRITAALIWAMAAWTVAVHIAVGTGGSFNRLVQLSPVTFLIAAVGWFLCSRRGAEPDQTSQPETTLRQEPIPVAETAATPIVLNYQSLTKVRRGSSVFPWFVAAALVLATLALSYLAFRILAMLFLIAAWLWVTFRKTEPDAMIPETPFVERNRRFNLIGLAALCLVGVLAVLCWHRPSIDDGFYVSVAADAHRHPDRAIWSTDTAEDDPRLPVFLPIYKAETFEYLVALAAKVFHVSSVRAAYTVLPIPFAILCVLAWALLAQAINPRNWLLVTAVAIAIAFLDGSAEASPGNFAFVKLQEGKTVLTSAIVPIICVFAWRFVTYGAWQDALMLIAAQIAGVGLSSSGILICPAVACEVGILCAPFQSSRRRSLMSCSRDACVALDRRSSAQATQASQLRNISETGVWVLKSLFNGNAIPRLAVIAASCVYPMTLALLLHHKMVAITWVSQFEWQTPARVVHRIFGVSQIYLYFGAMLMAWLLAPRATKRLLLAPGIMLTVIMINPVLQQLVQYKIFSPMTYWRVFWVVPWLVLAATFVCGIGKLIHDWLSARKPSLALPGTILCGLVLTFATLQWHPVWRRVKNGATFRFAGLDVEEPEYAVAQRLVELTPKGTASLAPESVACWTAVQDERPPLIFVRATYTQSTLGSEDVDTRNHLGEIVGKKTITGDDVATLIAGVNRYSLGSVVIRKGTGDEVTEALQKLGFKSETVGAYSIWVRGGTQP